MGKKTTQKRKKSTKAPTQKSVLHKLDEHLVATVLVVAGIAVLIILAGVITSTGKATSFSGLPDSEGVLDLLNQNTVVIENSGRTKCTFACGKLERQAMQSYLDGNLVDNDQIISGSYACSCVGIE